MAEQKKPNKWSYASASKRYESKHPEEKKFINNTVNRLISGDIKGTFMEDKNENEINMSITLPELNLKLEGYINELIKEVIDKQSSFPTNFLSKLRIMEKLNRELRINHNLETPTRSLLEDIETIKQFRQNNLNTHNMMEHNIYEKIVSGFMTMKLRVMGIVFKDFD